jgi:EEF1A lysine methyltransferase 2
LKNFKDHPEDEGTIWFSDSGAEEKVLEYLESLDDEGILCKDPADDRSATTFLDLGTGNGHLLFALRDEGWTGSMLGLDYSQTSVELACQIEQARRESEVRDGDSVNNFNAGYVEFRQRDILSSSDCTEQFDVLLDKGTFDAISLSSDTDGTGRRICEKYRPSIKPLLKVGGLFVITSCNWTEEELKRWFLEDSPDEDGIFELKDRLKYPTFRYQGQEGQTVVSLCFEKKAKKAK